MHGADGPAMAIRLPMTSETAARPAISSSSGLRSCGQTSCALENRSSGASEAKLAMLRSTASVCWSTV